MEAIEINVIFKFNNTCNSPADLGKAPTTNLDTRILLKLLLFHFKNSYLTIWQFKEGLRENK